MRSTLLRGRRGEALLLAASLAATLLALEIGLRVAGFTFPSLYTRDWHRGGALRPGAAALWTVEGESRVRVNAAGQRDRERALRKPPGVLRVAVLGDSFAEALQVPVEQAFWSVAERELAGCGALGGRSVEVLNFGVSGYGTTQELLTLRHVAAAYEPDVVLLAFFTGNDVRNNSRALERDASRPYFEYRDGALALDERFRERLPGPAALRLRDLAGDVTNRVRLLQFAHFVARRGVQGALGGGGDPATLGLDPEAHREPGTDAWREAWRVTEGLFALLAQEAGRIGARLVVATIPDAAQVDPDAAVRAGFAKGAGGDPWYAERRVEAACARLGVPALSLGPPLLAQAERTGQALHGFGGARGGHWNAAGHRLAGELIAREICRTEGRAQGR